MHCKTSWLFELCSGYPNFRESGFVSLSKQICSFDYTVTPVRRQVKTHWSVFVVKIFQRAGSWPVWVFAQIIQRGSWPMWVVAQINQWGSWPMWVVVQIIQRESWPVLYKCNFLCLPEEQFKNFMHYLAGSCTSRIYLHDLWPHCYTYQTTTFNYNFNWKNGNIKLSSSDNL